MRHPAVIASSIATVAGTAPGRTMLTYGAGVTAVRLMGRSPATVARLADAVTLTRELLRGRRWRGRAPRDGPN
ncbi:LLM class flavin-dependent oxidoreductase [Streptomyces noursei]|uniref:LLM class flavin-dependent oxidoreductase n=1 Tax=Streptomyces noursei TaxID=1971 RepID=UPI0023DB6E63|nr:LLM class flavin-dependent oxidoreductase [Streptomyces noursei]